MSVDQRKDAAQRIDLLPLHGASVCLTCSTAHGATRPTEIATALRRKLDERDVDWALLLIDPLSRWAGGGVEADNEAATRFAQVVETLCGVRGNPNAVLAHHSSKVSASSGDSDARGVTGIRDAFRWQVSLDVVRSDDGRRAIRLRNKKSNYSLEFDDLILIRNNRPGTEGTLRLATEAEACEFRTAGERGIGDAELRARVLATVNEHTGLKTASDIAARTTGTRQKILAAVKTLMSAGTLVRGPGGFVVRADSQSENTAVDQ